MRFYKICFAETDVPNEGQRDMTVVVKGRNFEEALASFRLKFPGSVVFGAVDVPDVSDRLLSRFAELEATECQAE